MAAYGKVALGAVELLKRLTTEGPEEAWRTMKLRSACYCGR